MQENANPAPAAASSKRQVPWWAKAIALIALFNLLLGLFNLSYVPMRNVYLRYLPGLVATYDPIKGIEPHPQTEKYLKTVAEFAAQVGQGKPEELRSPPLEDLLASLRQQSTALVEDNPFAGSRKFGTFAKIKRRIQQRVGTKSTKQALATFWTADYLSQNGVPRELAFFERKIGRPMSTNYFRYFDENGQPVDEFWRIDLLFIGFFAIDFLIRTFVLSRQNPARSWFDVMLRRWYDLFLLLPVWRWLRAIPVIVRLHQTRLLNLERAMAQITHEPAAYLSDRVSEFVLVRIINQFQYSIQNGELTRALLQPKQTVTVNDIEEVDAIVDRFIELTIYKVLPEIQPELAALLHHSLESTLKQSTLYETLQQIPALGSIPEDATKQISNYLARASYDVVESSYSDEQGREIFERLTKQFQQALRRELQKEETLQELQSLMCDWLEELKLTYVQRSDKREPEETMAEVEQLQHQSAEASPGERSLS